MGDVLRTPRLLRGSVVSWEFEDRQRAAYSKTVRAVREGLIPPLTLPDTSTVVPLQYTLTDSTDQGTTSTDTCTPALIDFVYPDIMTAEPTVFADRGILSPTNVSTDEINEHTLNLLPADRQILSSSNNLIKSNPNDIAEVTSPEFLECRPTTSHSKSVVSSCSSVVLTSRAVS
ncbi:unnamed protein product [Hapterophycus canaliculatus]